MLSKEQFKLSIMRQFRTPDSPIWMLMKKDRGAYPEDSKTPHEDYIDKLRYYSQEHRLSIDIEKQVGLDGTLGFGVYFGELGPENQIDSSDSQYVIGSSKFEHTRFFVEDIVVGQAVILFRIDVYTFKVFDDGRIALIRHTADALETAFYIRSMRFERPLDKAERERFFAHRSFDWETRYIDYEPVKKMKTLRQIMKIMKDAKMSQDDRDTMERAFTTARHTLRHSTMGGIMDSLSRWSMIRDVMQPYEMTKRKDD